MAKEAEAVKKMTAFPALQDMSESIKYFGVVLRFHLGQWPELFLVYSRFFFLEEAGGYTYK